MVAAHINGVTNPLAVVSFPTSQQGTLAPKMLTRNVTLEVTGMNGVYNLVSAGNVTIPTAAMGQVSVDVVGMLDGGEVVDKFNFLPLT